MWLMLQQDQPDDYVIATGQQHSVREFVQVAAAELGITVRFEGRGLDEIGVVESVSGSKPQCKPGSVVVRVDPRYFRPAEVESLLGNPSKAMSRLGWRPAVEFDALVREMSRSDHTLAERDVMLLGGESASRP
jgi:GDPmannose 4,6-dehydratase